MFEAQWFEVHNRKIIGGAHCVRCSARNLKHCNCEKDIQDRCLLNPFLALQITCVAALESLYLIGYMHFMGSEGSVLYDWLIQINIIT